MPKQTSIFSQYSFYFYLLIAIIILNIPFVSIPFKWFESYFHEISHGLSAILTGGSIVQIELFPNGAGLCTSLGGNRFIISFMGYAGAIFWGALLYISAHTHQRLAQVFSYGVMALLVLTLVLWVRDLLTLFILCILFAVLFLQRKFKQRSHLQSGIKVLGLMVLLNSVQSPLYLFDGRSLGDGASLAKLTYIPETIWIAVWCIMGLYTIYFLSRYQNKKDK